MKWRENMLGEEEVYYICKFWNWTGWKEKMERPWSWMV